MIWASGTQKKAEYTLKVNFSSPVPPEDSVYCYGRRPAQGQHLAAAIWDTIPVLTPQVSRRGRVKGLGEPPTNWKSMYPQQEPSSHTTLQCCYSLTHHKVYFCGLDATGRSIKRDFSESSRKETASGSFSMTIHLQYCYGVESLLTRSDARTRFSLGPLLPFSLHT